MKKKTILLLIALVCLGLTSCGNRQTPEQVTARVSETTEVTTETEITESEDETTEAILQVPEATAPLSSETESEPFTVTLAFAGDINFDDTWSVMANLHSLGDDLEAVIDPAYLDAMRSADLFWINNEFTYSDRGAPLPGKAFTFRSKPENVAFLQEMGVDIAGLANNHIYDYGEEAFLDTLDTLDSAGIPYVGAGHDLTEASAPVYLTADGVTIAYVAASRAEKNIMTPEATADSPGILRCYDNTLFLEAIEEAAENADFVVALPHWGTEYSTELEEPQISGAKAYIDAGADAVIGAHTHCLQGITSYDGKPIVYSLGNFWFNEKTLYTMLYEIRLTGVKAFDADGNGIVTIENVETQILPGIQSDCTTRMADEAETQEILDYLDSISPEPESTY